VIEFSIRHQTSGFDKLVEDTKTSPRRLELTVREFGGSPHRHRGANMSIASRHSLRPKRSWPKLIAVPILVLWTGLTALASDVRDEAGMFSPDAIRKAKATLSRVEQDSKLNVLIESVTSLNGRSPRSAVIERGNSLRLSGMLVLIAKNEHKIEALVSNEYNSYFPSSRLQPIIDTIIQEFKSKRFDEGLIRGAEAVERSVSQAKADAGGSLRPTTTTVRNAPAPRAPAPIPVPAPRRGNFGFGSVIGLILIVLAVIVVIRLIGGLFGAGRGAYGPGMGPGAPMGGPGYGPGPGPGYGYGGGRGGGFFSSLFGGIGGAMAGNWLYDQFSGRRHQQYDDQTYHDPASTSPPPDQPLGGQWGANEGAGGGWDDGSGGGGGGGDWGGGGGDWGGGGGGGDWGGSTGGGDWGGGGGGDSGGSW
jgi:uncharacterized protein